MSTDTCADGTPPAGSAKTMHPGRVRLNSRNLNESHDQIAPLKQGAASQEGQTGKRANRQPGQVSAPGTPVGSRE